MTVHPSLPLVPPLTKWRGHTVIFSLPKQVNVENLIMKSPSDVPVPTAVNEKGKQKEAVIKTPERVKQEPSYTKKGSTVLLLGEHPFQRLELSSSEGDSSDNTFSNSLSPIKRQHHYRSKSVSPTPAPRSYLPSSSRSDRILTPSPDISEPIDWQDFSDPYGGIDEYGVVDDRSSLSGNSWTDDISDGAAAIITPKGLPAFPSPQIDVQDLAALLNQPATVLLPTPPSTPAAVRRRVSKSPVLSAIPSVSTPSSPFDSNTPLPRSPSSLSAPGRLFDLGSNIHEINWANSTDSTPDIDHPEDEETDLNVINCSACGIRVNFVQAKRMLPCGDVTCSACFSSTISAVSKVKGHSQCVTCTKKVITFETLKEVPTSDAFEGPPSSGQFDRYPIATATSGNESVVMRIDNIAWDLTPNIVESFLPADTLAEDLAQAIHIPLDRFDGRTKDYMYIEVASLEASRLILQTRQNTYMPGGPLTGGRKRPVTITHVSHAELVSELRPQSSQELHSLLNLCHLALAPPTHASRFLKARHGPFYSLMSTMSKLTGKGSPAYWDLFRAISMLAQTINRKTYQPPSGDPTMPFSGPGPADEEDQVVLDKLLSMFQRCFGITPALS
ncbi:uncharacterized protein IL334_003316 [Kwoniella shivajii]|uniref:RING-type domain-containing protein n=1 Tax=Kwoniella shivajii TaxID=564305 RepID=A0ABZ1CXK4_9TREE|nr:hypothetical protein IL334_003316 [Kwoniella shivajii]